MLVTSCLGLVIWSILAFRLALGPCTASEASWRRGLKTGRGVPFGLAVWDAFHVELMPRLGTVPAAKDQPLEEHVSEILGHAVWMWSTDLMATQLYQQFNHHAD